MSAMANTTPIVTIVTKTATKEKTPKETDAAPRVNILDFCEEHYEDILPVIGGRAHLIDLATLTRQAQLSPGRTGQALETILIVEVTLTDETLLLAGIVPEVETAPVASKNHMVIPAPPTGHEPDMGITLATRIALVDPFTPRICNFKSSRKTRMPNNVKTYDGTGDPEDHVKKFQAAVQVERWAMPMWCHIFNSILIGTVRVWFDELPPESIDGYKDLKAAFLGYFMQQKKYVKDPVEIHNIK
ncbi:hypothetical protein Tco_1197934 [Tanacetum coccineum]